MMLKLEFSPRVLSMILWGFFWGGRGAGMPPWKLLYSEPCCACRCLDPTCIPVRTYTTEPRRSKLTVSTRSSRESRIENRIENRNSFSFEIKLRSSTLDSRKITDEKPCQLFIIDSTFAKALPLD